MHTPRLDTMAAVLAAAMLSPAAAQAASTYPNHPIRLVVPYGPGGNADIIARLIGGKLAEVLGQSVIIDNRPGASGLLGSEIAVHSAPDGYTLLWVANGHATNPSYVKKMPFDTLKDLTHISLTSSTPMLLVVNNALPADSMKSLIAYAKTRPGQINYATSGNGSPNNLAGELLNIMAGIKLAHVPYKSTPQATTDVIGGHVESAMASITSVMPHVRAGRLRALGTTGAQRSTLAPDIPAIAETVPGYRAEIWNGLLAPAGTPQDIIVRLNRIVVTALASTEMRDHYAAIGAEVRSSSPQEFEAFVRSEMAKWDKIVRTL